MKFLYVSFVSNTKQYSGILKKVVGQTNGAQRLGWDAHYTCVEGNSVVLNTGKGSPQRKTFANGLRWRDLQSAITEKICEFIGDGAYDAIYIKGFLTNPYAYRVASCAKESNPGCKVIFEIATYPYWGEYKRFFKVDWKKKDFRAFAGHLLETAQHCTTVPRMKRKVDALAVFGQPVKKLWGIPAVTIDNGITVDGVAPRKTAGASPGDDIHLLGVAGTSIAHGYFRIVEGLAQYQKSKPGGSPNVFFDIVGENETIQALKLLASELGVENLVNFLGYKNSQELSELYGKCDAAVSSLGVYQIGLKYLSPLKSREYCAAGIPFIYAYEDTLPADAPFALKIPNDSSPADIAAIARFAEGCRRDPQISAQEREFAKDHYDWKIIMKRVLDFAGAAAKDKN